jgi:type I restriction enzyme, S subunit
MTILSIFELVQPVRRANPAQLATNKINYIDIASIDREAKNVSVASYIDASSAPSRARQLLITNDVLVSTVRPNLNAVAIVPSHLNGAVGSTGFCVLRADSARLLPDYLFYYSQTAQFVSHLSKIANGASYPAVSDDDVLETTIPLPPITEQDRIVRILKGANRLRGMRRYALQMCDELLPAAFLEMFGDPVRNSRSWPVCLTSKVGEVQGGLQQIARRDALPLKKPFLRVANVQRGILDLADIRLIGLTEAEFNRTVLQTGDLLLVEGNGNPSEVGRAGMWDGSISDCVHQNHLIRIRCDKAEISPTFLLAQLNSKRGTEYYLKHGRTTSGLVTISTGLVNDFPALVPPLKYQHSFERLVTKSERLRATQVEALREADHLFQTLLHQAFSDH